jgi:hypothetical protein
MVLYRSEISCWWWKKLRILNLSPCTQKMCSLLPWLSEFPVYFLVRIMYSSLYLHSWTCSRLCQKAMNYNLFEHKHSFRDYFFRPLQSFFSTRKSRWTLFFLNLSVNMSNIWENYKLVSLILCVNFSTKFRLIEISFSGGHFIIVRVVKRRETTGKYHTSCVVPQMAH